MRVALLTGSLPPHDVCGVGDYTKRLHDALAEHSPVDLLHVPIRRPYEPRLMRVFQGYDLVHAQYPTEGWGKSLVPSLLPLGRLRHGRACKLVVTLHEWSEMNPLRRRSIAPLVNGADAYVFVTPFERDAFLATASPRNRRKPVFVIPIGVNLDVPALTSEEVLAFRAEQMAGGFDLLLTHFGFVHEGKQPRTLLDMLEALVRKGHQPRLSFVGGFQSDKSQERAAFEGEVVARGLSRNVEMKGFVEDERLAALCMAAGDANVSLYSDGLSSRRGSFWYAAQNGGRLITTQPRDVREFDEPVQALLHPPQVTFVPRDVTGETLADAVLASQGAYRPFAYAPLPAPHWSDIAAAHAEMYRSLLQTDRATVS